MGPDLEPIRRAFGPGDLKPVARAAGVHRTVLVQTISSIDETREFLAIADEHDLVAGVVGWVDLTAPDVAATLRGLGGKLVGIRHQVHDEADPRWLLRDDVQRGVAAVGAAGLVYDLLVRARELPAAVETAKRHADMTFVIDHAAKPRIAAGAWDAQWERAMAPMAQLQNVSCKISGLVTEADWNAWTPEQLQPYVAKVLEWFGPERCMFGSDWPVCLLAASYEHVIESMRGIVGDDDNVFTHTATRVYGLDAG